MTKAQAQRLVKKIFEEFGSQIREACKGTSIPPYFIAGLIANEAGKDKQGNIKREATRFEPHVYAALKAVRDGKRKSYGSITRSMIADATDASLKALATSHEATQIMGYHVLTLGGTVGELSDPSQHFKFTVKLLQANGFPAYPNEASMDREMRQWNTGSESGKTYHENYVPNARMIRAAYAELEDSAADAPTQTPQTIEQTTDDTTQTASDTPPPTLWERVTGWTDTISAKFTKVQEVGDKLAPISSSSKFAIVSTKAGGWAMLILGFFVDHWLWIVGALLIVAGIWYFSRSKDRAQARS